MRHMGRCKKQKQENTEVLRLVAIDDSEKRRDPFINYIIIIKDDVTRQAPSDPTAMGRR